MQVTAAGLMTCGWHGLQSFARPHHLNLQSASDDVMKARNQRFNLTLCTIVFSPRNLGVFVQLNSFQIWT
jgi:hypothetical protein